MDLRRAWLGKLGIADDAWMAVRIGGKAKVLRTHPPGYVAGAAQGC
jgi:hypothetical protein